MSHSYIITAIRTEFSNSYKHEGKLGVFCVFRLGDMKAESFIRENGGKYPCWDQQFEIELAGIEKTLNIEVHETISKNETRLLGTASIETSEIMKDTNSNSHWLPLNQNQTKIGSFIILSEKASKSVFPPSAEATERIIALPKPKQIDPIPYEEEHTQQSDDKKEEPIGELQNVTQLTREHIKKSIPATTQAPTLKDTILQWVPFMKKPETKAQQPMKNLNKSNIAKENANPRSNYMISELEISTTKKKAPETGRKKVVELDPKDILITEIIQTQEPFIEQKFPIHLTTEQALTEGDDIVDNEKLEILEEVKEIEQLEQDEEEFKEPLLTGKVKEEKITLEENPQQFTATIELTNEDHPAL